MFRVDGTTAVDDQLKLVFRPLEGRCHGNQFLFVLNHIADFRHARGRDAARWASVGLCVHLVHVL